MEYVFIYLLQVADAISNVRPFFTALSVLCVIAWAFCSICALADNEYGEPTEDDKEDCSCTYRYYVARTAFKKATIFCFTMLIIASIIPTKQTMLLIGGTYLAKKTITSEVVNSKLSKIDTIIDIQLDKYIKELQKEKVND